MNNKKFFTREDMLKLLRVMQGKRTQRALADDLGVHETYIGQVFRYGHDLTARILSNIRTDIFPNGFERKIIYVPRSSSERKKNG